MSDPMNAPSGTMSAAQSRLRVAPDAYLPENEAFKRFVKEGRSIPALKKALDPLNMTPKESVKLVKRLHCKDYVRTATGDKMATCMQGPGMARKRSEAAKSFINVGFAELPELHPFAAQAEVARRIMSTMRFENMGPEMCIGRLRRNYPRRGAPPPSNPPTQEEALRGLADCGLAIGSLVPSTNRVALQPYPLRPERTGELAIKISKRSYNGLPTEGDSGDAQAMERCHALAVYVQQHVRDAYNRGGLAEVDRWVKEQRRKRPYLTTLVGRAKDDCYTFEKYHSKQIRFYNVWPRPVQMVIQTASQALKALSIGILGQEDGYHCMSKGSLAHGGAQQLVDKLQKQVDDEGFAFVVMGDDSWIVVEMEWKGTRRLVLFALDCISYDLTLRAATMREPIRAIADQMALIDGGAAGLWKSLMQQRDVVVMLTLVETMEDGGPSGAALQSDVNSVVMTVYIRRLVSKIKIAAFEASQTGEPTPPPDRFIAMIVEEEGQKLGLKVKLEQYFETQEETIKGALAERPFLFLGYYFHVLGDTVAPFCDLSRCLATAAYPTGSTLRANEKKIFNALESMRIAGTVISMGVPPRELSPAFEAMRAEAIVRVREQISLGVEPDMEAYPDYVLDNELAPYIPNSLVGLYEALLRRSEDLWLYPPPPPPMPFDGPPSTDAQDAEAWGDLTQEEDEAVAVALGRTPVKGVPDPRPVDPDTLVEPRTAAGSVTPSNHGRPPPTGGDQREGPRVPGRARPAQAARAEGPVLSNAELVAQALEEGESDEEEEERSRADSYDSMYDGDGGDYGRERGESMGSDDAVDAIFAGVTHVKR